MTFKVHCYFLREGTPARLSYVQKEVDLPENGRVPQVVEHEYDAALLDEDVQRRFDPRLDWEAWATGKHPFARRIKLYHEPALGLLFLDATLKERLAKHQKTL
jgi:hypothetical protein